MKYSGGKGKCYQRLINLMPKHHTYIEPYLGGGAVLRNKLPAQRNIGIDIDPNVISKWETDHQGIAEFINTDAIDFLNTFKFDGQELVYLDPPYLPSTRRRSKVYRYDYSEQDHIELLRTVVTLPAMVMISGYGSNLYDSVLSSWNKVTFQAKTHVDVREECVWLNFEQPKLLHDSRHLGDSFRERQTINRKRTRIHDRITKMSPHERNDLILWINETFKIEQELSQCKSAQSF